MDRLKGKTAIVTGGGSGMGQAIARLFAEEGAHVVITDIDAAGGRSTADAIGNTALFVAHDVTDEAGWTGVIEATHDTFGGVDILVNNAGTTIEGTPEDTTIENWRRVNAINVEGVFFSCRAAIPALRERGGGSIVNIASRAAIGAAAPYMAAYGASKGAVRQYTKQVAIYCAQAGYNIRCNSINPGAIDTPLLRASLAIGSDPAEREQAIAGRIPLGRIGRPEDVAFGALFLASDEAAFITGAELNIDGGVTAL